MIRGQWTDFNGGQAKTRGSGGSSRGKVGAGRAAGQEDQLMVRGLPVTPKR